MRGLRALRRRLVGVAVRAAEAGLSSIGIPAPSPLLLLGHMRSGSTLLLHILLMNPEIAGLGERNAPYASVADLSRLVIATRLATRDPFARWRYVADQINHNHLTPGGAILMNPRVRLLFLLREPESSVQSLLELTRTYYEAWSVERAVDYYTSRLDALAEYGRLIGSVDRAGLVTYADLTDRSAETLARLQQFLGTRQGFRPEYRIRDFTGKRGDPSPNILTGHIGRPQTAARAPLPADALAQATRAHARCRDALDRFALVRGAT